MIKNIILTLIISVTFLALSNCSGEKNFGETFQPGKITPISEIDNRGEEYIGKTIQMEGKITKVCTTMKCWFYMKDKENRSVYVDLDMNSKFSADISNGDTVIVKGKIRRTQPNSPKLALMADGIMIK